MANKINPDAINMVLSEMSYRRSLDEIPFRLDDLPGDLESVFSIDENGHSDLLDRLNEYAEEHFGIEGGFKIDRQPSEDVAHIWHENGFSAFVVKDENNDYTIAFRGSDVASVDEILIV